MEMLLILFGVLFLIIVYALVRRGKDYEDIKKVDEEICNHPERFEINLGKEGQENWQDLKSYSFLVNLGHMSTLCNPETDPTELRRKKKPSNKFEIWQKT